MLLLGHIFAHLGFAGAVGFSALLEVGELLAVAAGAGEGLLVALAPELQLLMAVGAAGVGDLLDALAEAAIPVRAHQHVAPFAVHQQEHFAALGAG